MNQPSPNPKKVSVVYDSTLKKRLVSSRQYCKFLAEVIDSKKPLLVTRVGGIEGQIFWGAILSADKNGLKSLPDSLLRQARVNAGINRTSLRYLKRFSMELGAALCNADALGIWDYIHQAKIVKWSGCNKVVKLNDMNPITCGLDPSLSWTHSLAQKNVLVILPFESTLLQQFKKISERKLLASLWPSDVKFSCISPPVTFAGMNAELDWHQELNKFCSRLASIDFDVALIGAGAYGALIADFIKRSGKQAIHLGGSTQLLFGIMGGRWTDNKRVLSHFNADWSRPSKHEVPVLHNKVDQSSYW